MKIILLLLLCGFSAHAQSPIDSILTEESIYALRDPFRVPNVALLTTETVKSDLELFALKEFKLAGVITGAKKARAMVTLPNSKSFFLSVGDHIGLRDGHVVSISSDSIRVVEYDPDESGKKVPELFQLSISGEIISLTKKEER